ncbi:transcription termination/antitermination protein NusG [Rummeliibacillus pycnus]|uniref:transcription termination/antitermination protein NusG n=1 Tax=Rummeliibacillus pycnus TaxID=101070 RepID=UPI003D277702
MSYFVVSVKTGTELNVKEMLLKVLALHNDNANVEAIYAMETYTNLSNDVTTFSEKQGVESREFEKYQNYRNLQSNLNNLRIAYDNLKTHYDAESLCLKDTYSKEISVLTKKIQQEKQKVKKIISVLKGYIIIKTTRDTLKICNSLWHIIKSIPNVIGFPSIYSVPQEEMESFMRQLDLSPEVQVKLGEVEEINVEEMVTLKDEILSEANTVIGTQQEKELLKKYDQILVKLRAAQELKQSISMLNQLFEEGIKRCKSLKTTFTRCTANDRRNKLVITMSMKIYRTLKLLIPTSNSCFNNNKQINNMIRQLNVLINREGALL